MKDLEKPNIKGRVLRYNSTAMNASIADHWLSPDPAGLKAVTLTDPQTWRMIVWSR